jgi:hypothetical protein
MVTKWNPRWSDTLPDEAYDWPYDIPIFAGDPMDVGTTFPTQDIVDSLSGLNQIVAAKNRLALKSGYSNIFELEYSTMFDLDNWYNFSDERLIWPGAYYGFGDFFNTIKRQIDAFYYIKGIATFPWTYPPPADPWIINKNLDSRFMHIDVNEIRKALDVSVPDQKIIVDATVGAYFLSDAANLPNVVVFPVPPYPPVPPEYLFAKLYNCFNGGPDPVYPGRAFQTLELGGVPGHPAYTYIASVYKYRDNTPPHEDDYEFTFVIQLADFRGLIKPYFPLSSQISGAKFLASAATDVDSKIVVLAKRIDESISEDPITAGWFKNNASSPTDPPLCDETVIAHPETYIDEFVVAVSSLFQDYRVDINYGDYHPLERAKLPLFELALKHVFDQDMPSWGVSVAKYVDLDHFSIEILGPFL